MHCHCWIACVQLLQDTQGFLYGWLFIEESCYYHSPLSQLFVVVTAGLRLLLSALSFELVLSILRLLLLLAPYLSRRMALILLAI